MTSLKYWPSALAQLSPITPSGPHQSTDAEWSWNAVITSWISLE